MANRRTVAFIGAGAVVTAGVIIGGAFSAGTATPKKVSTRLTDFKSLPFALGERRQGHVHGRRRGKVETSSW